MRKSFGNKRQRNKFLLTGILPSVQVLFAVISMIYAPFQFHSLLMRHGEGSVWFFMQNWPPPLLAFAEGLSFPALLAMTPLNYVNRFAFPIVEWQWSEVAIRITMWDVGFVICVGVLWYLVGRCAYSAGETVHRFRLSEWMRVFGVLTMGVLCATLASLHLSSGYKSHVYIGVGGLLWALIFLNLFIQGLRTWVRARQSA